MGSVENSSQNTASPNPGETPSNNETTSLLPVSLPKKKRNLPGMPDPEAEVIALSPKTLLATNRFVCEICNKGFQRDQNLQLHRRGHNLPWKLKQRSTKEPRKKVYVCPETTCVHHHPTRALGDLTGIKKHFCRKHGEKKWKCERCSKKYAVQSDWKAHMKTCGTREYKCDCGTLFSRRDSFITHRAFCDALAEETVRTQNVAAVININSNNNKEGVGGDGKSSSAGNVVASPPPPPLTPSTTVVSPGLSVQSSEIAEIPIGLSPPAATTTSSTNPTTSTTNLPIPATTKVLTPQPQPSFSDVLSVSAPSDQHQPVTMLTPRVTNEPPQLSLSPSLYLFQDQEQRHYIQTSDPAMSATALLQKAAQMGATTSNHSYSFLRGLGLSVSSTSQDNQWGNNGKPECSSSSVAAGLGIGLPTTSDVIMGGSSSLFANKPTTLDLLGLGMDGANSALLNSYGGSFSTMIQNASIFRGGSSYREDTLWDGAEERKPNA